MNRRRIAACLLLCGVLAEVGEAGQATAPAATETPAGLPFSFNGPSAPVPPEVISRDAAGHATLRAVRLPSALRIDGLLNEEMYTLTPAISGFIQNDPQEGAPASEKTEVWIFFDDDTLYVSARCWESRPDRMIANEMRRDNTNVLQNDGFAFAIDPFYDRRNALAFEANSIGGRVDAQFTNESQANLDWNPVWELKTARFDRGWAIEMAVPFKSLRYRPGQSQIWGFNARRINRWKNEVSYLTPIPAAMTLGGHWRSSLMATLVGLEAPSASRNLEIKPYAISDLKTDVTATPRVSNDARASGGLDVKYALSQSFTANVTYRTDFAQVEADEQQVNLTRFSLLFPEKREFFLENQGTFGFASNLNAGGPGGSGANSGNVSDTPVLFYSRRIGLNGTREVPIKAGGSVTGRSGRYSLGLLNIEADDDLVSMARATNFTIARVKRDILRKSTIGAIVTNRSVGQRGVGTNQAYGIDGRFGFYNNLAINTYWARTQTSGLTGTDQSYRGQLDYNGDRYGVQIERLVIGREFNPEVGFLRRTDIKRSFGQFRFSPRPRSIKRIRRLFSMGSIAYIENGAGRLETRDADGEMAVEFQNGDRLFTHYSNTYEYLPQPFLIATGITLPVQGYNYASALVGLTLNRQRSVAGTLSVEQGTFYNGHKTSFLWNQGRVKLTSQFAVEPRISVDRVELLEGSFTTQLFGSRVTYTMTPLMFVSALVQYSSTANALAANVRLRWEYRPGSELFVVWNEQRDTRGERFPALASRALVVKINRLLRF